MSLMSLPLTFVFSLLATAFADEEAEDTSPQDIDEIVVFGELELARRRALLEQEIEKLGYHKGKNKENRTVYRPDVSWKPSIVLYDDALRGIAEFFTRCEREGRWPKQLRFAIMVMISKPELGT